MAQSVEHLRNSGHERQVMISQFVSSGPTSGFVLAARSLPGDSLSLPLSLCPSSLCLPKSVKKNFKQKRGVWFSRSWLGPVVGISKQNARAVVCISQYRYPGSTIIYRRACCLSGKWTKFSSGGKCVPETSDLRIMHGEKSSDFCENYASPRDKS